jgi:S-formylglutathione hydrolase
MADYVTKELPEVVDKLFKVDNTRRGITGHSVGGHGAMITHFRNPGMYKSVSALAPVCNPSSCQWGKKAFEGFLGSVEAGAEYDSTLLVAKY